MLLSLAITKDVTAEGDAQVNGQRVRRTINHRDEVIEQLQLPDKPEITVIINYQKNVAKPMPVMLGPEVEHLHGCRLVRPLPDPGRAAQTPLQAKSQRVCNAVFGSRLS